MSKDLNNYCIAGNIDKVKELLSLGIDPSLDDNYPIRYAAHNNHLDIVKLLLKDKRVDPSANCNSPLTSALQHYNIEMLIVLLNEYRVTSKEDLGYLFKYTKKDKTFIYELLNIKSFINSTTNNSEVKHILDYLKDKNKIYDELTEEEKYNVKMKILAIS